MTKAKASPNITNTATIGFEAKLWLTADKLRNNMNVADSRVLAQSEKLVESHSTVRLAPSLG